MILGNFDSSEKSRCTFEAERLTDEQIDAWSKVRNAFASQSLSFPTAAEIALYAKFVSNKGRKVSSHGAAIVPFSRDTSEKA